MFDLIILAGDRTTHSESPNKIAVGLHKVFSKDCHIQNKYKKAISGQLLLRGVSLFIIKIFVLYSVRLDWIYKKTDIGIGNGTRARLLQKGTLVFYFTLLY